MRDINESCRWPFAAAPAGASTWPVMAGKLTGFGQSHYLFLPNYHCPHLVVAGKGYVKALGHRWEVGPGDMFSLWPEVRIEYGDTPEAPWRYFWLHLAGPGCEAFTQALGFGPDKPVTFPASPGKAEELFARLHQLMGKADPQDGHQALAALYSLPQACGGGQSPVRRDILNDAIEVVDARLGTGLNVNELCDILKVSRATLFRAFNGKLGVSPAAYLGQKRLDMATRLLAETNYHNADIAELCGFASEKYFFRRFKEMTGKTPGAARKELAAKGSV